MTDNVYAQLTAQTFAVTVDALPVQTVVVDDLVTAVVITGGPPGPPGDNAQVFGETPTGVQNGSNEVFTLLNPYVARSTQVFRNGLRELLNVGYTESGIGQITFTTPPLSSDVLTVDYLI